MLWSNDIESTVIEILQQKELKIVDLIEKIRKRRGAVTKQGVYRVIRHLREQEVVVVYKGRVALSQVWVQKMSEFFTIAKHYYSEGLVLDDGFLNIEDGSRITYRFKSPYVMDRFWGHVFGVLGGIMSQNIPAVLYNTHEWFLLARYESERLSFDDLKRANKRLLVVVGHDDVLDKSVRKEFDGDMSQYHIDTSTGFKENYYLNVFGDYLIEAYLDKVVAQNIDDFYKRTKRMSQQATLELRNIVSQKGSNRFVVSRNKKKADRLRKKLSKPFYIPKGARLT